MRLVSVVTRTRSPFSTRVADLGEQVVDLVGDRADLDLRIEQAGRADDLLDDDARAPSRARSRPGWPRRRSSWVTRAFQLVELERSVVERARQAEAVLDERLLARAVAAVHRPDLRHRLVRLVDDQEDSPSGSSR